MSSPTLTAFKETASGFRYLTLDYALDLFDLQCADPIRYPFLLESSAHGPNGRYDILFAFPGDTVVLTSSGRLEKNGLTIDGMFLDVLSDEFKANQQPRSSIEEIPFTGGWFVFLSYEMVTETEPSLKKNMHPVAMALPVAVAARVPVAIVVDHVQRSTTVIAESTVEQSRVDAIMQDVSTPAAGSVPNTFVVHDLNEEDPEIYLRSIARIKQYIRDGDIFQANLSRLWRAELDHTTTPMDIYAALRRRNPAPFSGLALLAPRQAIISSSPERLVSVRDGIVCTRPIAGTHPRGDTVDTDRQLAEALLRHPKERAEHIMLIDLERNDLGRVCRPGSVNVSELMALETYAHVHHIVSEVRGVLDPDMNPVDVIRAVFPGGTITGCPKVRCMEIIHELEKGPRGAYTGSMGYINRDGSMDMNILIRTLVQNDNHLSFRAGGGIVADSEPQRELDETRAKARGMLLTMEGGERT